MKSVNVLRVFAVAVAVLTATSLVTGQAAEFVRRFASLFGLAVE